MWLLLIHFLFLCTLASVLLVPCWCRRLDFLRNWFSPLRTLVLTVSKLTVPDRHSGKAIFTVTCRWVSWRNSRALWSLSCKCESFYGSPLRCTIEQIAKKWFLKSSQYTCVNELLVGQLTRVIREAGIELEAATFRTRRNHFESASTKQTLHSLVEFWRISFTQTGLFTATHILHCQLWRLSAPQISHQARYNVVRLIERPCKF